MSSDRFQIGKYDGMAIREVVERDPKYCLWAQQKGVVHLTRVQIYLCKKGVRNAVENV